MGQEDKKRAVFLCPACADNPGQVFCLLGQPAGVDQDNGIRCGDKEGIGRYYIDLPDERIDSSFWCSRDLVPRVGGKLVIASRQVLLPLTNRLKKWT